MVRFLVRTLLKVLAFMYVLPHIHGIQFHGTWVSALILSVFFTIMLWAVEALVFLLAALLTVSTFGLALLFLIPCWVLGFWLLPAVALKLLADLMPHTLVVAGWIPALLGGLVLLVVSLITVRQKRWRSIFRRDS